MFGPSYCLAERSALANGHLVAFFNTECWRDVGCEIGVSLLVSRVLGNEMEVFSSDNQGSVHLCGNDCAGEDPASNGDHAGEWIFLVCKEEV